MPQHEQTLEEYFAAISTASSPDAFLKLGLDEPRDLPGYLNRKLEEKGLRKADVIHAAQLNETFGYQIFSGQRNPSRNKVLALAFGLKLDMTETRHLLAHANVGDIVILDRRDAIISFCIIHGYNLLRTDEELYAYDEETISDPGLE